MDGYISYEELLRIGEERREYMMYKREELKSKRKWSQEDHGYIAENNFDWFIRDSRFDMKKYKHLVNPFFFDAERIWYGKEYE